MIEIHFQHIEDARRLSSFQQPEKYNNIFKKNLLHNKGSYIVQYSEMKDPFQNKIEESFLKRVKQDLCEFIITFKLHDWLKQMLSTKFHYHDELEQQYIIDIVLSMLNGKVEELNVFLPKWNMMDFFSEKINEWISENKTISFETFVLFRLRSFFNELKKYVELSLDEYKMEQEYQMFIQLLRDFLKNKHSKMEVLHLVIGEDISFYNENFVGIKRSDLAKLVDRKLLNNHPVYIDSVTIAPLLSVAPTKINIYADDTDLPIIRTICNIFEERVVCYSIDTFHKSRTLSNF